MYDRELVVEDFRHIAWSLDQIEKRFSSITSSNDFIQDDAGLEKLDSICMQLIAIGETLKHIDKLTTGSLLCTYPEIDWKKAMGIAISSRTITSISIVKQSIRFVPNICRR